LSESAEIGASLPIGHRHGRQQDAQVFLGVAEGLLPVEEAKVRARRARRHGRQVLEHDLGARQPRAVRLRP